MRILFFIYNLLMFIVILILFPFYFVRAYLTGKDKHGLFQRIGFIPEKIFTKKKYIWVHAVSAGEAKVAVPIINKLKTNNNIVVSVGTETGYKMIKEHFEDQVDLFYMPVDFFFFLNRLFKRIKPESIIIVETEIWPQLIRLAYNKNIPIFLINGRMPPRDFKNYKYFRFLWKHIFRMYTRILVTNNKEKIKFTKCGADEDLVEVFGNIKFDIYEKRDNSKRIEKIKKLLSKRTNQKPLLVVGSTHKNEEEIIFDDIFNMQKDFDLILAPRHLTRVSEVENIIDKYGLKYELRSGDNLTWEKDIVLWDTMGELDVLYKFADVVIVGGSWIDQGGHNIIEPAIWGVPIIVGPYMYNFQQEFNIFKKENAIIQAEKGEIGKNLNKLLNDKKIREKYSSNLKKCIDQSKGAVEKYIKEIQKMIE